LVVQGDEEAVEKELQKAIDNALKVLTLNCLLER
jgi:hypothetical protein